VASVALVSACARPSARSGRTRRRGGGKRGCGAWRSRAARDAAASGKVEAVTPRQAASGGQRRMLGGERDSEAVARRGSGKRWPTPRTGRRAKHAQRLKDRAGKWGRISCGRGQKCWARRTGIFRRPDNHFGRPRNAAGHRGRVPKFIGGDPEDPTRQTRQPDSRLDAARAASACVHSNEHPIHHPERTPNRHPIQHPDGM
jgi:hypothetical protein